MADRADRLRHGRLAQHASVRQERSHPVQEVDKIRGAYVRFSFLKKLFDDELLTAQQAEGDDVQVEIHMTHVLRCYFLFLAGTVIFVDTSATYTDVAYLRYFLDFTQIHEYNWGAACLAYLYSKLSEGCLWRTKQVTCNTTLLVAWILQHFPHIAGWASVTSYTEEMPHACAFIPLRGNQEVEPFRVYLD